MNMIYEFMNVKEVANWIENIGTVHAANKANELRTTYEEMERDHERTSTIKQWMIDSFEDGEYDFRRMECDVVTRMIVDPFVANSDAEAEALLAKHMATLA